MKIGVCFLLFYLFLPFAHPDCQKELQTSFEQFQTISPTQTNIKSFLSKEIFSSLTHEKKMQLKPILKKIALFFKLLHETSSIHLNQKKALFMTLVTYMNLLPENISAEKVFRPLLNSMIDLLKTKINSHDVYQAYIASDFSKDPLLFTISLHMKRSLVDPNSHRKSYRLSEKATSFLVQLLSPFASEEKHLLAKMILKKPVLSTSLNLELLDWASQTNPYAYEKFLKDFLSKLTEDPSAFYKNFYPFFGPLFGLLSAQYFEQHIDTLAKTIFPNQITTSVTTEIEPIVLGGGQKSFFKNFDYFRRADGAYEIHFKNAPMQLILLEAKTSILAQGPPLESQLKNYQQVILHPKKSFFAYKTRDAIPKRLFKKPVHTFIFVFRSIKLDTHNPMIFLKWASQLKELSDRKLDVYLYQMQGRIKTPQATAIARLKKSQNRWESLKDSRDIEQLLTHLNNASAHK